jgi:hypothetical protein
VHHAGSLEKPVVLGKRVKDMKLVFSIENLSQGTKYSTIAGDDEFGNATPFAILTTFDQAALVWLPSGESDDIIKEELEKFQTNEPEAPAPSSPKASGENKKNSSPDPHEIPVQWHFVGRLGRSLPI